ncbi:MAG: hypothetical protein ACLTGI_03600 [Hoylesella buccalis]
MKRHLLSLKWAHIMVATLTLFLFSCKIQPDEQELVRHGDYTYRGCRRMAHTKATVKCGTKTVSYTLVSGKRASEREWG